MRIFKKFAVAVTALALTVGMSTSCLAATWDSYFGLNKGWYEGAEGELKSNTATGWKADLKSIGWGGCWGGQVFQKVKVKKGEEYRIKYTISSSNCDKWVFLKISKGDNFAYGKWVQVKKGKSVTVDETFKAKNDADQLTFGIGGEFGDREGSDKDAKLRYAYAPGGAKALDDKDATFATVLTCKDFSFGPAEADAKEGEEGKTSSTTVPTGDFAPIACGAAAVIAAAVIVVFARKRETN